MMCMTLKYDTQDDRNVYIKRVRQIPPERFSS